MTLPMRNTRKSMWNAISIIIGLNVLIIPASVFSDDQFPGESALTRITHTPATRFFLRHTPDGAHLIYSRQHANRRAANQILVGARMVDIDGLNDHPLLPDYEAQVQIQEHPVFSPDGRQLLISGGGNDTGNSSKDVFVADVDAQGFAQKLRKVDPAQPDAREVLLGEEPAYSPDGRQIAFVTIDEKLGIADSDGTDRQIVVQVTGQYCHQPDWSPDGQWIAFASDREGNIELFRVRRDGTELTRMTNNPGIDCRPRWSRDGRWVLFTSSRTGNFDLFAMRADGGELHQLTTHPALDDHADWHPDGRTIAFISLRRGTYDIFRMDVPQHLSIGDRVLPSDTSGMASANPLVLYYSFDRDVETSGQVIDLAGRNHGRLQGAQLIRDGSQGRLAFDGIDSWADCGNGEQLRGSGALTVSLWVRPDRAEGNQYLVSKQGWNIYLGNNAVPHFETRSAADSAWDTLPAKSSLPQEQWSQLTAVFDPMAGKLSIYVNGQHSESKARTDGAIGGTAAYPLELGHYNQSKTQKFAGQMDELRIMQKAMSAEDISSEYARQATLFSPR